MVRKASLLVRGASSVLNRKSTSQVRQQQHVQVVYRWRPGEGLWADLPAQLVPGQVQGPELGALPLTGSREGRDLVPTQPQRDQSLKHSQASLRQAAVDVTKYFYSGTEGQL